MQSSIVYKVPQKVPVFLVLSREVVIKKICGTVVYIVAATALQIAVARL